MARADAPEPLDQFPELAPLEPLAVSQLDLATPAPTLDDEVLSLLLSEPLPVVDLLRLLLRETGISLVPDPGITETFTGELKNVTLRRALDLVLRPIELEYRLDDDVLRVVRRPLQTRVFEVNVPATRRVAERVVSAGLVEPRVGSTLRSTDHRDPLSDVAQAVEAMLSPLGESHLDRGAGLLRVRDTAETLDAVARYLERVRDRAGRQVRLQARILEVAFFDPATVGLDWPRLWQSVTDESARATDSVLRGAAEVARFMAALETQGVVTTVSEPMAVTLNNEPAQVRVGGLGERDAVVLAMTPQVGLDGLVTLSVTPRVTTLGADLTVRELDTLLRVRDGETAILGGWFRRRASHDEGVEASGRIDGAAAGSTAPAPPVATDLVILLTPTVLPDA